ncbi:MAG: ABC transporter permease [Lachnospiraceae bacterium]|nr:ABC transporter permease [Lachnospiraceae bacterium]
MFIRMIGKAFFRQWKKMTMIALTIALGASLATAMLSVMIDVEDKINQELKVYGANIKVVPKDTSVIGELYDVGDENISGAYLKEDELGKIKTIFWAFNIVDYAPFINTDAKLSDGTKADVTGTWFNHHMDLPTGEELDAGIASLRSWWDITEGEWLDEQGNEDPYRAMAGAGIAEREGISAGDTISVEGAGGSFMLTVVGIFDAGGEEDDIIYVPVDVAQEIGGLEGRIDSIEVSALTTPDNDLARKAAQDPSSLSVAQYETWYCTAYVSSICYQIEEVITDSVASAVRQVADSEGQILKKTKLLMILITILSMIGAALGICNLVTASVMERSQEIGLMKAIGAHNGAITGLILAEIMCTAVAGGVTGFFAGLGFAQIIGHSVFASSITMRPMVIPLVAVLVVLVTLIGSIPAIRLLLGLKPTEVLHGK